MIPLGSTACFNAIAQADSGLTGIMRMSEDTSRISTSSGRRHFMGGSDGRVIMGNEEAALLRLWRENARTECCKSAALPFPQGSHSLGRGRNRRSPSVERMLHGYHPKA
jgi:hypothetical protein